MKRFSITVTDEAHARLSRLAKAGRRSISSEVNIQLELAAGVAQMNKPKTKAS